MFVLVLMASGFPTTQAQVATDNAHNPPKVFRDIIWVWGNPEMAKEGPQTLATFAQANSAQRARLLGVPNVVLAGQGLPDDDAKAEALTERVAGFRRLVWETRPDGKGIGPQDSL